MRLFSKILQVGLATEPLLPSGDEVVRLLHEVDARARRLFGRALAIREKIGTLEAQLGKILDAEPPRGAAPRRKRKLSAAAKAKISAAAKARWARFRATRGNK